MIISKKGITEIRGTENEIAADLSCILMAISGKMGDEIIKDAYAFHELFNKKNDVEKVLNQTLATLMLSQLSEKDRNELMEKLKNENNNTN